MGGIFEQDLNVRAPETQLELVNSLMAFPGPSPLPPRLGAVNHLQT